MERLLGAVGKRTFMVTPRAGEDVVTHREASVRHHGRAAPPVAALGGSSEGDPDSDHGLRRLWP